MPGDADGNKGCNNSTRIEPKRSYHWFMDGPETELFSKKKQAIEPRDSMPVSGISHTNAPQWESTANCQSLSGKFANHLFGYEPVQTVNFLDRSIHSLYDGNFNVERRGFQDRYDNPSMGLSMSHFEDPSRFTLGEIRNVRVNPFGDSADASLSASVGLSCGIGDKGSLSLHPYNMNSTRHTLPVSTFSKPNRSLYPVGHSLNKGEENPISMCYDYSRRKDNLSLMGRSFDNADANLISIGQSSGRGADEVRPLSFNNKRCHDFMSLGHTNDKTNEKCISVGSSYYKGSDNQLQMPLAYDKHDSSVIPIVSTQNKRDSGVLLMGHKLGKREMYGKSFRCYQKESETHPSRNIISSYDLVMGSRNTVQALQESSLSTNSARASQESSLLVGTRKPVQASQEPNFSIGFRNSFQASQGPSFLIGSKNSDQGSQESSFFIGSQNLAQASPVPILSRRSQNPDQPSKGPGLLIVCQNSAQASQEPNLLISTQNSAQDSQEPNISMRTQSSAQPSEEPSQPKLAEPNVDSTVNKSPVTNSDSGSAPKPKAPRKAPSNSFPANVRNLMSTGMLDGIPVKYVSWCREKSVKATIKGTGYICGCSQCKYTKTLNAYEFERHADGKTKHPNNHIYFANGKSIYAVVQELKNTPQDKLFDAIQNVTGSPINQEKFRIWKESYQAATRELQRIYGKDGTEVAPSSS